MRIHASAAFVTGEIPCGEIPRDTSVFSMRFATQYKSIPQETHHGVVPT
jgi:hypothetical protein